MTPAELEAAALAWAKEHGFTGHRLPAGVPCAAGSCPLARATEFVVSPVDAYHPRYGNVDLPVPVQRFVYAFDRGEMPERLYDRSPR